MQSTEGTPVSRYRLGPRSTRGLIAGWRSGQILCVGVGLVVGVGFLRSVGGLVGLLFALACAGGSVVVATWRLGGRSAEEWAPTIARFAARAVADGGYRPWTKERTRPGSISRLSMFQLPSVGVERPIGVLEDAEASTWSAVLRVDGDGFALLSEAERSQRITAWSGVLVALARESGAPHRLQWIARTYPAVLDGPPSESPSSDKALGGDVKAASDYEDLLAEASPHLWTREVLVVVTVRKGPAFRRGGRGGRGGRGRPAGRGHDEGAQAIELRRHMDRLAERLSAAGLSASPPLGPRELARVIRNSFDRMGTDMPVVWPWPVAVRERWASLLTDDSCHAAYWIAEWPRAEVASDFLLPMLVGGGVRRTVSLTMAPLPPLSAVRRAERERTSGAADAELRQRHGFAVTARARREQEARLQREGELAEGHAGFLYSGYVSVTERSEEELEDACRRVEQAAAVAQLELRRLYGAQEEGFCCVLPAGRGCK